MIRLCLLELGWRVVRAGLIVLDVLLSRHDDRFEDIILESLEARNVLSVLIYVVHIQSEVAS